jgi:Arc/MetJ family transcription regulator
MKIMTFNVQEELLEKAAKITGIHEKTALIHYGLKELIRKDAVRRLIARGGSDPIASAPPRKRVNSP